MKIRKTKIFRHFISCLNVLACSVPFLVLTFVILQNVLPKYFTSLVMQHHGDGSSTFDDDLQSLNDNNIFTDLNDNMLDSLDRMNYLSYVNESTKIQKKTLQTNEVNNFSDLVEGNVYMFTRMDKNNNFSLCEYEDISGYLLHFQNCYSISGIDNYLSSLYIDDYYLSDNFITENYFEFMLSPLFDEEAYSFSIIIPFNQETFIVIGCDGYKTFDYIIFTYDTNCFIDFSTSSEQAILADFISACPSEYLPLTTYYEESTSTIQGFDGWKAAYDGESYTTIVSEGCDTHLIVNIDFISLFTQSEIINYNNNVAIYLFINFYINYLINILLILFLPEFILIFIDFIRELLYKFTDTKEI